jgi:ATP-binding cassette subfamily B (MDR/TAP) protein 1
LSTIRRADKIVVIRAGQVAEQGSHDELLKVQGVYYGLVQAQNLEMGTDEFEKDIQVDETEQIREEEALERKKSQRDELQAKKWKTRGVFRSFGLLIYEQRKRWFLYTITLVGAAGAGAAYPMQAYLFAHLVNVFTFVGYQLVTKGNFYALMFFILAIAVLFCYYAVGFASHLASIAVSTHYRQEYLENILKKRITFFDSEGNSPGTLTSRLATDSTQIQELLGTNIGLGVISVFNLTGSIIISFVFGWKLALVGVFSIMPIVLMAGYFRVTMERGFEALNAAVFAESSQFGTEAVSAFRTVTSLLMEDMIIDRFDGLLKQHVTTAFRKARWATIIVAFSDSAEMFCQALCFYYGGTLLAKKEYDIVKYFVVYMSALTSAQAAGIFFSFAPNLVEASAAANRILSVRPTKEELNYNPKKMEQCEGAIGVEFQNVDFSYKERGVPVLTNLNLQIKPGQFAALVGATGCGKSTIISLLERFYDVTSGKIMFGDTDITTVDAGSYRLNLSLVYAFPNNMKVA